MIASSTPENADREEPLKVVHLSTVHPITDNRIFYKQCLSFAGAGFDTVLIIPHTADERIEGVQVRALRKPRGRLSRLFLTGPELLGKALKERANAYHIHDPELTWVGLVLRLLGRPVVFDMHENLPKQIRSKDWIWPIARRPISFLVGLIERIALPWMHVVFAEVSYAQDYPWIKRSVTVLNLPRLSQLPEPNLESRDKRGFSVGYIGRLHEDRGAMTMLEALALLKEEGMTISCDIVGDGAPKLIQAMESFCRQNNLQVTLHGPKKSSDGLKIIAANAVGLALLKPIPNYVESYPTKIFEYMALGIPVVASDFPLYRSIIDRHTCGICVDAEDVRDVAGAIRRLCQSSEMRSKYGENGLRAVHTHYSWDEEASKLLTYYRERLLNSR
ncbi:MAG: glycosyltransferase [Woeseiaceae bacterium]|nr:glycosyltransferase [Woeseiaceae bacterium]